MTIEELRKLIHEDTRKLEMTPNTKEYATLYKEAAKAAYELDDFPVLAGLESTWKLIESDFPLLGKDREDSDYESPVSRFMYCVDMGFYPPPEIMLSLLHCFQLYYAYQGGKSLDEIFFGTPHKKKSSHAFSKSRTLRYSVFRFFYATENKTFMGKELSGMSLVERAEEYLKLDAQGGRDKDPETFLRGYRRWLKTWEK